MKSKEIWKSIPNWEGLYEVSSLGRIRSLDRYIFGRHPTGKKLFRFYRGRILSPSKNKKYARIVLSSPSKGKISATVHSLVTLTFYGKRPEKLEVCHNNGNGFDNRLINLRYDTRSANTLDCIKHGKHSNFGRKK